MIGRMAFWSGEKLLENKGVVIPFSDGQVDCNAYTLRMGNCYYRTADRETGYEQKKTFLTDGESFLIPAGQFAYLLTKEEVNIPHYAMAFISMRTPMKFQGLINVSGFHVDPGYNGKLVYAVYNASPSPIQICENDKVFKIWFCDIDRVSEQFYRGKPLNDISNEIIKGMSKEIFSLQTVADKIRNLDNAMNARLAGLQPTIDNLGFIWRAIIIGVVASIAVSYLALSLPVYSKVGQDIVGWIWPSRPAVLSPSQPSRPPSQSVPSQ
jgi:dCTP deaminase